MQPHAARPRPSAGRAHLALRARRLHPQPWAHAPTPGPVPLGASERGGLWTALGGLPARHGPPQDSPDLSAKEVARNAGPSGGAVGHAGWGWGRRGAVPGPADRQARGRPSAVLPALTLHCPRPGPVRRTGGATAFTGSKVTDGQAGAGLGTLGGQPPTAQGSRLAELVSPLGFGTRRGGPCRKNQEEAFKVILRLAEDPGLARMGLDTDHQLQAVQATGRRWARQVDGRQAGSLPPRPSPQDPPLGLSPQQPQGFLRVVKVIPNEDCGRQGGRALESTGL